MSVYFITCRETGTVKIGSSLEPHARLKELQTAHPYQLVVEAILPGGTEEEFELHRRFSEERLKGEWFRITEMIELIIKNNPAGPPPDYEELARLRAEAIRLDPVEQAYAAALTNVRASPPRRRTLTPQEKKALRDGRRMVSAGAARGDIYFPFRNGGSHKVQR